ncbi:hypothetical protein NDU88_005463 [Pleurodeles waltl]|uniref:Secreted protein n=1 Tax=Pleurodeles waltl TaxID=8319 RepID=A0AAV7LLD5_PLEWA|nr:hypothetical protein NDU88_005463 [Pleurodeles waltl]
MMDLCYCFIHKPSEHLLLLMVLFFVKYLDTQLRRSQSNFGGVLPLTQTLQVVVARLLQTPAGARGALRLTRLARLAPAGRDAAVSGEEERRCRCTTARRKGQPGRADLPPGAA